MVFKNKIEVPDSVDCNIYEMTPGERRAAGIENMPADLKEAVDCLVADEFLCSVLGEHITAKYVEAKSEDLPLSAFCGPQGYWIWQIHIA